MLFVAVDGEEIEVDSEAPGSSDNVSSSSESGSELGQQLHRARKRLKDVDTTIQNLSVADDDHLIELEQEKANRIRVQKDVRELEGKKRSKQMKILALPNEFVPEPQEVVFTAETQRVAVEQALEIQEQGFERKYIEQKARSQKAYQQILKKRLDVQKQRLVKKHKTELAELERQLLGTGTRANTFAPLSNDGTDFQMPLPRAQDKTGRQLLHSGLHETRDNCAKAFRKFTLMRAIKK